jgi:hypothetical protein
MEHKTAEEIFKEHFDLKQTKDGTETFIVAALEDAVIKAMEAYALQESKQKEEAAYEKGYSDGRNGLHNADLENKLSQKEERIKELESALRSISGIEAWIQDHKMKLHFQKTVYSALQPLERIENGNTN